MASIEHLSRPAPPVARALTVALARTAVGVVVGLSLAPLAPSVLAGWWSGVVVSGSMAPAVRVGDVVVTRPVSGTPEPGRVIAVHDPRDRSRVLVHRLHGVAADGRLVTKGDANAGPDSTPVARGDVIGVAVVRVPMVGRPVVWARSGDLRSTGLVAAALTLLTLVATRRPGLPEPLRRTGSHVGHRPPRRRAAGRHVRGSRRRGVTSTSKPNYILRVDGPVAAHDVHPARRSR